MSISLCRNGARLCIGIAALSVAAITCHRTAASVLWSSRISCDVHIFILPIIFKLVLWTKSENLFQKMFVWAERCPVVEPWLPIACAVLLLWLPHWWPVENYLLRVVRQMSCVQRVERRVFEHFLNRRRPPALQPQYSAQENVVYEIAPRPNPYSMSTGTLYGRGHAPDMILQLPTTAYEQVAQHSAPGAQSAQGMAPEEALQHLFSVFWQSGAAPEVTAWPSFHPSIIRSSPVTSGPGPDTPPATPYPVPLPETLSDIQLAVE